MIELFFIVDIVLKFNTKVYINGVIYSDRLFIAKNYLKTEFFFDILAIFPFELMIPQSSLSSNYLYISADSTQAGKYLWLVKLIRLLMGKVLIYELEDYFVSSILLIPIKVLNFLFSAFV